MIIFLIDSYWEINPNPKGVENMDNVKVSLDQMENWEKPQGKEIARIHNRLGSSIK